jgi:hypothetical protein
MRCLALGIKWFGTSISQSALKNLVDKKIRLTQDDKKNGSQESPAALSLGGLRNPKNLERLMHMSQLNRWSQISKYFLPSRSGEFLSLEFNNILNNAEKCTKFISILMNIPSFKRAREIQNINEVVDHLKPQNDVVNSWFTHQAQNYDKLIQHKAANKDKMKQLTSSLQYLHEIVDDDDKELKDTTHADMAGFDANQDKDDELTTSSQLSASNFTCL